MQKQLLPSVLFLIAFSISLAHNSVPHTHPGENEMAKKSHSAVHHHRHKQQSMGHRHSDAEHSHDQNSDLPVFSHFSNADFINKGKLDFSANVEVLKIIDYFLQTDVFFPMLRIAIDKVSLIPRSRELPILYLTSENSLRAPPVNVNQCLG